jgi:hypothetical protein
MLNHSKKELIIISIIYAIIFGICESSFRYFTHFIKMNDTEIKYTTYNQFIISMIWTPILLLHKKIKYKWLRYILYPFNIYLCEIILGGLLLIFFDTRAWHYMDKYSHFNGLISYSFYPLWFFFQFPENYIYIFIKKHFLSIK